MKFPMEDGRIAVTSGTPTAADQYQNGVRLEADSSALFVTTSLTGAVASDGFLLSPDGAVVTVDCPSSLPAGATFVNGFPVASNGAICTSTAPVAVYQNGMAFTAFGALAVGSDAGEQALAVLAKYGVNAHMWMPGVGIISGVTVKNWLDTAGTVPATEGGAIARVDDAGGGAVNMAQTISASRPILRLDSNGEWCWACSEASSQYLEAASAIFQMTEDAVVIAGASLSAGVTANSRVIFGQGNASNHRVPQLYFNNSGQIGVYAFGGGTTVDAAGGADNRGAGPIVATMLKTGSNASVRRNGIEVTTAAFSGTYGTGSISSIGAYKGVATISPMQGNIYPVIAIKATVPIDDVVILEEFVAGLSGAVV